MQKNVREAGAYSPQSGFTLIELMIVVAIIGILATLALTAYQNYIIRAQVSDGLALTASAKTAASDYYMNNGDWPQDNTKAGIAKSQDIKGKYTKHVKIKSNMIEIEFGGGAHKNLRAKKVYLTGVDNNGSVSWSCAGDGAISLSSLPSTCR